ncbi:MAG: glycosyltransferase [Flavobacteriales bacterium]|nr:glycosyltransferase [Flavobacteriales bacterium]
MSTPRIAIISPNRNAYSETFIAAHIARLQAVELVLTDGHLPKRTATGEPLLSEALWQRVRRKVSGTSFEQALSARVAKLLKAHRINVVLAEYGPTGEAMWPICERMGLPLVVHFHGIDAFHVKLLADNKGYARTLPNAAALVVVSHEMEEQLLELGAPRDRLHYVRYGVELDRFQAQRPDQAPPHFLSVGRFVDKKAPALTLLAFHKAWEQCRSMRLTMAGNGPLWESTRQLVKALGLEAAVELPGAVTHDRVAELMAASRAFVQHSVVTADNDHEGTPLSVLEAMASGMPVVATRHAGIPDVVEHGVSGLLCGEREVDVMGEHLLTLARDPALALRMGQAGRARAERDHRQQDRIAQLQGILAAATRS